MEEREVIEAYYAAMRRGADAEDDLLRLFAPDAVYVEPFTTPEPAIGIDDIRARLRKGWEVPLPDLELDVLEIDIDGTTARSRWECRSPGLPGPVRGEDRYEIHNGRITRLEVRILGES